jgi:hypothetical protein
MFWNKKTKNENPKDVIPLDDSIIELGREVERGLGLWQALIDNHWFDMKGNLYHKAVDLMTKDVLKNQTLTNQDRIKKANEILTFSKTYRGKINQVASYYKEFISTQLKQFDEMLDAENDASIDLKTLPESMSAIQIHNRKKEWISLSYELIKVREREMFAINAHMDTDEFIPNLTLQDNGEADHKMTKEENEQFSERLATCYAYRDKAAEEERKVEPNRSNLATSMFGNLNNYMEDGSYSRLLAKLKN